MSKKLLLADDSITIQKVVGITFAGRDYELTAVGDGDSALEKARSERPDLVLADVCMPGKSGYELCAALKDDPSLCDVPVLLLTGTFEPFDESKANVAGADGWVAKPFESQALIRKVEDLLSRPAPAASVKPAPVEPPPVLQEEPQAEKPVRDIWADLSDLEPPEAAPLVVASADPFDAAGDEGEDFGTESLVPEGDDLFEGFSTTEETDDAAILDAFGEEEALAQDGALEIDPEALFDDQDAEPASVAGGDVWDFSADDEEILFLSEDDVLDEVSPKAAYEIEEPAAFDLLPEEPAVIPGAQEPAFAAEQTPDDDWFQAESQLARSEAHDLLSEEQGDFLSGDYDDFALELSEEQDLEGGVDDLELAHLESGVPDSDEDLPAETLPLDSSPEDPFQIGAHDFVAADGELPGEADDSLWAEDAEPPVQTGKPVWTEDVPSATAFSAAAQKAVAPVRSTALEEKVAALSEEDLSRIVEKVAGAVIERLAKSMLERIAWEVVPDLAEVMIKEEIRKIREEVK